jgi:SAM-dependent methyltransferase
MDRARLSLIAHSELEFAGPYERGDVLDLLEPVDPPPGSIVDVGCGEGSLLRIALERFPSARATGVDRNLGRAPRRLAPLADRVELVESDVDAVALPAADLVACVGSTHIFGGLEGTLDALVPLTSHGGHLLIGEGYWTRPPHEAALEGLGAEPDELTDLDGVRRAAASRGLAPAAEVLSSQQRWDAYESSWCDSLERFAAEHPGDPDSESFAAVAAEHRRGYLEGYRGVLGFGLFLWRVPARDA